MKIKPCDHKDIVRAYTVEFIPMIAIAKKYSVSRVYIHKLLNLLGVDTKKSAAHIQTICDNCNKPMEKIRCQIRKCLHVFCCQDCYKAYLNRNNALYPLKASRLGMRIARRVIKEHFVLTAGMVVHHEDRNNLNNDPKNLRVFCNQGEHVRYHRGFNSTPIFDGRDIKIPAYSIKPA